MTEFRMIDLDEEAALRKENQQLRQRLARLQRQRKHYRRRLEYVCSLNLALVALVIILMLGAAALAGLLYRETHSADDEVKRKITLPSERMVMLSTEDCAKLTTSIALGYGRELGLVPVLCQTSDWGEGSLTLVEFSGVSERQMLLVVACSHTGEINVSCTLYERGLEVAGWSDRLQLQADRIDALLEETDALLEQWQQELGGEAVNT